MPTDEDPVRGKTQVWVIHAYFSAPRAGPIGEDWTLDRLQLNGSLYANIAHDFYEAVTRYPTIWPKLTKQLTGTKLQKALRDQPGRPKPTVGDLIDELRGCLEAETITS